MYSLRDQLKSKQYESSISALENNAYHKLIIGAALKDYEAIEDFSYLFTHAKANVIDISAFPHSVICAHRGIDKALKEDPSLEPPIIMVSVNIGTDPHFRRIDVDYDNCVHCMKCVPTCPSNAFSIDQWQEVILDAEEAQKQTKKHPLGKLQYEVNLCFGCDNCLSSCKFDALGFSNWSAFDIESLFELIGLGAGGVEIHLNNDISAFDKFFSTLPHLPENFLVSFSIGSGVMDADELKEAVSHIHEQMETSYGHRKKYIIQTDGIPISGAKRLEGVKEKDLKSIENAKIVRSFLNSERIGNAYVQLAGGTDEKSLSKAHSKDVRVNGVAIGSYARKKLQASIDEAKSSKASAEEQKSSWEKAKKLAKELIEKSKLS